MSLHVELTLLTDVAVTERSATIGGHRSLPWITGASLLGALAGRLYDSMAPDDAWRTFHTGEVRFGNAVPIGSDGMAASPMPFSLHHAKHERAFDDVDRMLPGVCNLARTERPDSQQLKQLRDGFLDGTGRRVRSEVRTSMRTAVSEQRAREGFLYLISAIAGGTMLRCRIDSDDEALLAPIRDALDGQELRIGRSRQSEFGLVAARVLPPEDASPPRSPQVGNHTVFLCLSDLACRDPDTGQPTYNIAPMSLGLPPGWKLDEKRSFVRGRRYSPFNGRRNRPDLERQVITAGSVLCFHAEEGAAPIAAAAVHARLARGVGDYRQDGLGQLAWEPALLASAYPAPAEHRPSPPMTGAIPTRPDDDLARWLDARRNEDLATDEAWEIASRWEKTIERFESIPPAQWGEVRLMARRYRDQPDQLIAALERFVNQGIRKLPGRWGTRHRDQTLGRCLVDLVKDCARSHPTAVPAIATEILSIHIVRRQQAGREVRS